MATDKKPLDGRLVAIENEQAVLLALHRFGWLATRQIAAYCWPASRFPRMAQRTLERLREAGEVAHKRGADGATVYALTPAGARRVRDVFGVKAGVLKDLGRKIERNYSHRCTANDVAIWWASQPAAVGFDSEHEVSQGQALINKQAAGFAQSTAKIPDALLFARPPEGLTGADALVIWVEAEGGFKNGGKQQVMVEHLARLVGFGGTAQEVRRLGEGGLVVYSVAMALVACPTVAHEHRLARYMLDFLHKEGKTWGRFNPASILGSVHIWRPGELPAESKTEALAGLIERTPALKKHREALKFSR